MSSEDFQIISSLRYDPKIPEAVTTGTATSDSDPLETPYYLLPYHQDRLRNAALCFNWQDALSFLQQDRKQFVQFLDTFITDKTQTWRLRILIGHSGDCTVETVPAAPANLQNFFLPLPNIVGSSNPWQIYIDSTPTTPSEFTAHKTTVRENYSAARLRAGIRSPQEPAEVLIVNPDGEIMEGSITTPYFRPRDRYQRDTAGSNPEWVTPPLSSGGNAGTTRQYSLDRGFCTEQTIRVTDLVDGEECLLSNGVRGFIYGKVRLRNPKALS